MNDSEELERKALVLWRRLDPYKKFLPKEAKEFFRELADLLKWELLKKEL